MTTRGREMTEQQFSLWVNVLAYELGRNHGNDTDFMLELLKMRDVGRKFSIMDAIEKRRIVNFFPEMEGYPLICELYS